VTIVLRHAIEQGNNNSANNMADLPKEYNLNYFYIIIEMLRVLKIEAICKLQSAYF